MESTSNHLNTASAMRVQQQKLDKSLEPSQSISLKQCPKKLNVNVSRQENSRSPTICQQCLLLIEKQQKCKEKMKICFAQVQQFKNQKQQLEEHIQFLLYHFSYIIELATEGIVQKISKNDFGNNQKQSLALVNYQQKNKRINDEKEIEKLSLKIEQQKLQIAVLMTHLQTSESLILSQSHQIQKIQKQLKEQKKDPIIPFGKDKNAASEIFGEKNKETGSNKNVETQSGYSSNDKRLSETINSHEQASKEILKPVNVELKALKQKIEKIKSQLCNRKQKITTFL